MTPSSATESGEPVRPPAPFIVGVGRSGTTLLRMMLDAHTRLAVTPETHFGPVAGAFDRGGPSAAVETIIGDGLWGDYNLSADEFARRVQRFHPTALADVLRLFYELYAEQRGKPLWGDKTPDYVAVMTEVQQHLPEARFVHVVRDGRDVALSMAPLWFGAGDISSLARAWAARLTEARRQAADLRYYVEVRYEDLVRDPPAVLRRICDFLELEWEPSMLDYHRDAAQRLKSESPAIYQEGRWVSHEERLAIHRLTAQPPRCDRTERWRREMGATELDTFERIAGETLAMYGYELSGGESGTGGAGPVPARRKVFCIGFHKTGTKSMAAALDALGYKVASPFGFHDRAIRQNALPRALELARDHDAAQDNPWPLLYRELDRHFPGSCFVLTVRDPQRWLDSVLTHFGEESTPMREWIYGADAGAPRGNEQLYLRRFERHQREVREHFAGREGDLLVMDLEAGDGWQSLCSFLGVDSPDRPFPHANRASGRAVQSRGL